MFNISLLFENIFKGVLTNINIDKELSEDINIDKIILKNIDPGFGKYRIDLAYIENHYPVMDHIFHTLSSFVQNFKLVYTLTV